ncbi:MAG: ChbG/HpnK family deacetylase [bacterium]
MIVCADDYGLTEDINWAILDLAGRGRLSAVSIMIALPQCDRTAVAALQTYAGRVELGLHLVLTDARPLGAAEEERSILDRNGGFLPFGRLMRRACVMGVRPADVAREVGLQVRRFEECVGARPKFIDSHLHVHQFPGVAEGVAAFVAGLPAAGRPAVRNACVPLRKALRQGVAPMKNLAISLFGRRMRRLLRAQGIVTNEGFAGIYDYRRHSEYKQYLKRFLSCMESPSGILMVHPGGVEAWRRSEYEALGETELPVR